MPNMPTSLSQGVRYHPGDVVYFHADPEWELEALHDSDGCAYDQDGSTYSTAIVVSWSYVGGFNWQYSYDVLCGDGVIRRLAEHDIAGAVEN